MTRRARSLRALAPLAMWVLGAGACAPHAAPAAGAPSLGVAIVSPPASAAPPLAPAADPVADPAVPGPYVAERVSLPHGLGALWLPSPGEGKVDAGMFPLPLVVFAAGFAAHPRDYEASLRLLVSHGFAVLAADHGLGFASALVCQSQAAGLRRVERAMAVVRDWARSEGPLRGFWSGHDFATLGHSFGGKVALWLARTTPGVAAVVAWDPVDGGGERAPIYCFHGPGAFPRLHDLEMRNVPPPPTLLFGAGQGGACAPAGENAEALLPGLPGASLLWMPGAGHADFVDAAATAECPACGFCPPSQEDAALVQRFVRGGTVAFLKSAWLGDARYAAFVRGTPAEGFVPAALPAYVWREAPSP